MYAGGLFIILLGVFINQLILRVEKNSSFWKENVEIFDIAAPSQTSKKRLNSVSRYYVPAVAGLILAIVVFGGREVRRVNSEQMNNHSSHRAQMEEHSAHSNQHKPGCNEMKDNQSSAEQEASDQNENVRNYISGE
jgi:ABC-type nickel/cobalt efflux system permease component RcnA